MSWIDWSIIICVMLFIAYVALSTKKYTRSVADFLAANRCAGRYLLGVASGEAALGAISIVMYFELFYKVGFTKLYWDSVCGPLGMVLALSGFIYYRFRSTRALTLAQFFEQRYSRKFRIFAGILAFTSGIINFGVFPGVAARFFMNFFGFKSYLISIGPIPVDLTLAAIMFLIVGIALFFTFNGGQIAIIVTDFWQGFIASLVLIPLIFFLWKMFPWSKFSEGLILASKPGESLINPFDINAQKDFNIFFYAISWFFIIYHRMAWQGTQGYNCAAKTPHEGKMAGIIGGIRGAIMFLAYLLIPLTAVVYMNHPDFASGAAKVTEQLQNAFPGDDTLQMQMRVPVYLKQILPVGLMGGFAVAMLGFFISTNNTYMHSWGSVFIQDIVCPLRKIPFEAKRHLLWLRLAICGVAGFSFVFSLFFPMKEYIYMFFMITGAIYLGGAGTVIIGGLYWKRGTTSAAWASMIVGSVLSVGTIILRLAWSNIPLFVERWGDKFPVNSQIIAFICAITAVITYVLVSLLGKKQVVNIDKLLHRGKYAIPDEEKELEKHADHKPVGLLWRIIGVNSHEFSKVDKGLFIYTISYTLWNFGGFITLLIVSMFMTISDQGWLFWWKINLGIILTVSLIACSWFNIGGLIDLRDLYKRLRTLQRDEMDDGRVYK